MVSEIVLDLELTEGKLTGTAHMAAWPGDAAISEFSTDGDSFSFTVVGHLAWTSKGPWGEESGVPKLTITGTAVRNDMDVTLIWDDIILYGDPPRHEPRRLPMKAFRIERYTWASRATAPIL